MSGLEDKPLPVHLAALENELQIFHEELKSELPFISELATHARRLESLDYSDPRLAPHKSQLQEAIKLLWDYVGEIMSLFKSLINPEDWPDFEQAIVNREYRHYQSRFIPGAPGLGDIDTNGEDLNLCVRILMRGKLYSQDQAVRHQAWQDVANFYSSLEYITYMNNLSRYGCFAKNEKLNDPTYRISHGNVYDPFIYIHPQRQAKIALIAEDIGKKRRPDKPEYKKICAALPGFHEDTELVVTALAQTGAQIADFAQELQGLFEHETKSAPHPLIVAWLNSDKVSFTIDIESDEHPTRHEKITTRDIYNLYNIALILQAELLKNDSTTALSNEALSIHVTLKKWLKDLDLNSVAGQAKLTKLISDNMRSKLTDASKDIDNILELIFRGANLNIATVPGFVATLPESVATELLYQEYVNDYLDSFEYPNKLLKLDLVIGVLQFCQTNSVSLSRKQMQLLAASLTKSRDVQVNPATITWFAGVNYIPAFEFGGAKTAAFTQDSFLKLYLHAVQLQEEIAALAVDKDFTLEMQNRFLLIKDWIAKLGAKSEEHLKNAILDYYLASGATPTRGFQSDIEKMIKVVFASASFNIQISPEATITKELIGKTPQKIAEEFMAAYSFPDSLVDFEGAKRMVKFCLDNKVKLTKMQVKLLYVSIAINHPEVQKNAIVKDQFQNFDASYFNLYSLTMINLVYSRGAPAVLRTSGVVIDKSVYNDLASAYKDLRKIATVDAEVSTPKASEAKASAKEPATLMSVTNLDSATWDIMRQDIKDSVRSSNSSAAYKPLMPAFAVSSTSAAETFRLLEDSATEIVVADTRDESTIGLKHEPDHSVQLQFSPDFLTNVEHLDDEKMGILRTFVAQFRNMPKNTEITIGNCADSPETAMLLYKMATDNFELKNVRLSKEDGTYKAAEVQLKAHIALRKKEGGDAQAATKRRKRSERREASKVKRKKFRADVKKKFGI